MEESGQLHVPSVVTRGESPGTYCIGGWVGSIAGLDALKKRKILFPLPEIEPRPSIQQPVAIPSELSRLWKL
jgi:hypothetical protein